MRTEAQGDRPEPPPVLARAFIEASRDALDFLVGQPGFQSAVIVEERRGDEIVPADPATVSGLFWVRRTFATNRLTGAVTYGERELEVNLLVNLVPAARGTTGPYGLWEWLAALGAPDLPAGESSPSWCASDRRVRAAVAAHGQAFRNIAPRISSAGPDVVQKIEAARVRRHEAEKNEHAEWAHQDAAARAAEAFRAGDYRRVVSLLAPIEARLTPAEQKKLALARKRV